jgi:DNA-directed RNA polymerase specialized sigma24 family protein
VTIHTTRVAVVRRSGRSRDASTEETRWTPEAGGLTPDDAWRGGESQGGTNVLAKPSAIAACNRTPGRARGKREELLSQDAFDSLLAYLDPNRQRAGKVYETMRTKLIKFFEARGCSLPAEYADETINRVANNLQRGKRVWTNPPNYFLGVARNVLKEYWASRELHSPPLESLPPQYHPRINPHREAERESESRAHEQRLECLARCLEDLPAENRDILLRYYYGDGGEKIANRKKLAKELGVEVAALRLKAFRIRQTLEARFNELVNSSVSSSPASAAERTTRRLRSLVECPSSLPVIPEDSDRK